MNAKKPRSSSFAKCAKFLMRESLAKHEQQIESKKPFRQYVQGILDPCTLAAPVNLEVPSGKRNGHESSRTSVSSLESAICSVSDRAEVNDRRQSFESNESFDENEMQSCSVAEKIRRWNQSIDDSERANHERSEGCENSQSLFYSASCSLERLNAGYHSDEGIASLTEAFHPSVDVECERDLQLLKQRDYDQQKYKTTTTTVEATARPPMRVADEKTDDNVVFTERFVGKIFRDYESVTQNEKAQFGVIARTPKGREHFARALNNYRVGHQKVDEGSFLSLVQSIAVVLFECSEAGDWSSAKNLMNMCFTFYTEDDEGRREHLYTHLASQHIWQSLLFWNSAFFEAILAERAKFNLPTKSCTDGGCEKPLNVPDKESQRQCLQNITFSQLATFTHNMHAFGLPFELCVEFLDKQTVIGNLSKSQVDILRENIETIYGKTTKH